ncbi:MAG: thiamine diphosphokinase [Anaerobutyricum sp.]|nr:thiamine diphosphokinase [Anaerobutyricum sp.]
MEEKKILIVSGGTVDTVFAREYLKEKTFDRIIAADAGLAHCMEIGVEPTDILGDFDSLQDKRVLEDYKKKGIPLKEFPERKDYTDTHLALTYAIALSPSEVVIFGATGTRLDHTLANIGLLAMMCDHNIPCRLVDQHNEIEMLSGPAEKRYPRSGEKKYFSLLAFSEKVSGIDEIGFSYPLENGTLSRKESMGVSNEIVEEEGIVRFKSGYLLVMQTRD